MSRAMRTAATGMLAQELYIDTIANNLANVNTTGFKKSKVEFQDLLYQNVRPAGTSAVEVSQRPSAIRVGYGTRVVALQKIFTQGAHQPTGNALDLVIEGDGFFQVRLPDGEIRYSRDGAFKRSSEGVIVNPDGFALEPEIRIPEDATSINIGADGTVSVSLAGETQPQDLGQIELARFINAAGLDNEGRNLYRQTVSSGDPILGIPGQIGFGNVGQGYLELSNVEVVEEMVNMIIAQRAYEVNTKAIRAADDMLAMANQLKR
ncbi:flagellar basal-body rod protein FlgG [candidate division KSB1 bacterium]